MTTGSNKQIDLVTKFESMSNELLMELFEYSDLYSLFFSFGSLNSRFDNLLRHCQVHVDLDRIHPIEFVHFLAHILPQINPKNIRSLHGTHSHQITVLAYDKSLVYFTHIRSLSLSNIHPNTIEHMISRIYFFRLQRVLFDKCVNEFTNAHSVFKHFFDPIRYHCLRTYKDSFSIIEKVPLVLLIEHVTISQASDPCHFLNFLNQSPHLKYVKTKLLLSNQYPEPVFLSPISYHHALTHLSLYALGYVCTKTIVYLFKCVPRIYDLKLKIEVLNQPELVYPIFWERLLSNHLAGLKRLSLKMVTIDHNYLVSPLWNTLKDKEKVIEQIEKSNYWSSHQWQTTFESNIPTPSCDYYSARFRVF